MALFKKGRLCFEREESFDQIGAKNRHEGGGTEGGGGGVEPHPFHSNCRCLDENTSNDNDDGNDDNEK